MPSQNGVKNLLSNVKKPSTPVRKRTSHSPGRILAKLIQVLPNRHGAEVFAVLRRAFWLAFGVRVHIIRGVAVPPGSCDSDAIRHAISTATPAGRSTPHFPQSTALYLPLMAESAVVGVLAIAADPAKLGTMNPESPVFKAFRAQTVLSVLRFGLDEEAQRVRALQTADRLQKALLSSISHNVRTPIASILGSLGTLRDDGCGIDEHTRRDLIDNAFTETERLNRLFGNLLDLNRLEAGALRVRSDVCDVQDVIGAAIEQLGTATLGRLLRVDAAPDLPFVRMDFVLIAQTLVNLLDNAFKYSGEDDSVVVEAVVQNNALKISVLDEGSGIPEHELANIFEKFNRAGRSGETGGLGLGLSISRGLVEAHHGTIWAERRNPRGAAVRFTIPLGGV